MRETEQVFTASNDWQVKETPSGVETCTLSGSPDGWLTPDALKAVIEFGLQQHGLWLAPNRLVCALVKDDLDQILVLPRKRNRVLRFKRSDFEGLSVENDYKPEVAARAFFAAHPKPKPKPKQCDAVLEIAGAELRCGMHAGHETRHAYDSDECDPQRPLITWETPR